MWDPPEATLDRLQPGQRQVFSHVHAQHRPLLCPVGRYQTHTGPNRIGDIPTAQCLAIDLNGSGPGTQRPEEKRSELPTSRTEYAADAEYSPACTENDTPASRIPASSVTLSRTSPNVEVSLSLGPLISHQPWHAPASHRQPRPRGSREQNDRPGAQSLCRRSLVSRRSRSGDERHHPLREDHGRDGSHRRDALSPWNGSSRWVRRV